MACQQIICILVLTVFGAHGIMLNPPDWIEGDPGLLTCTDGDEVIISLDGTVITRCLTGDSDICNTPADYFTITVDGATNTVTFTINSVNRTRDEGTWSCKNDGSVDVDVKVQPTLRILITLVNGVQETKLACEVLAANPSVPDDGFTWEKDGSVIAGATTSTYTINQAQLSDKGNYVCTGNNSVGIGRSPSANFNIPAGSRITVVVGSIVLFLLVFIFAIPVIYIIYVADGNIDPKAGDVFSGHAVLNIDRKLWIWLITSFICQFCDCFIGYSIYVLVDPEEEFRYTPAWYLTVCMICLAIITLLVLFYLIYQRFKYNHVSVRALTLLLFVFLHSLVALVMLIMILIKKTKDKKEKKKEDVESGPPPPGGTGPRQLPKLPKIEAATGKKDTTVM